MKNLLKRVLIALSCAAFAALLAIGAVGCSVETTIPQWIEQQKCQHEWNDGEVTKAATCTKVGEKTFTCEKCEKTKVEEIEFLDHDYILLFEEAETCTQGKEEYYECVNCAGMYSVKTEAKGHTSETVAGKAATCTETGLTDGEKCSTCGEVLTAQEEIPAPGHSYEWTVEENTHSAECSVCGQAIEEAAHSYEWVEGDGKDELKCVCGKVSQTIVTVSTASVDIHVESATFSIQPLLDENTTEQLGVLEFVDMEFNGERWNVAMNQIMTLPVSNFGEARGAQTLNLIATTADEAEHSIKLNVVLVAAGDEGHAVQTVAGNAATCIETGLTDGITCECGYVIQAQEEIPATGHTYENNVCVSCGLRGSGIALTKAADFNAVSDYTGRTLRYTWEIGAEDYMADDLIMNFGDEEQGYEIGVFVSLMGSGMDCEILDTDVPTVSMVHSSFNHLGDDSLTECKGPDGFKTATVEGISYNITRDDTHIYCDVVFADVVSIMFTMEDGTTETKTYDVLKGNYYYSEAVDYPATHSAVLF